jgi:hypothetical protein
MDHAVVKARDTPGSLHGAGHGICLFAQGRMGKVSNVVAIPASGCA